MSDAAPWMLAGLRELGVHETPGPASTPRVLVYHEATTLRATDDAVPWCAAFVNWCLQAVSIEGTASAVARSFLGWGLLTPLRYGAIVVLARGADPTHGHVGFCVDADAHDVLLLGGNQGDQVSIRSFPTARLLGARWPRVHLGGPR